MTTDSSKSAVVPLSKATLHGVWPALILPWSERDELDEQRYAQEVESYGNSGVQGVYTGGTTGEFYAQDDETFQRIAAITCSVAHRAGLPVQIGCTALSTRTVKQRVRIAKQERADGIQLALPFWMELSDAEVMDFVSAVAEESAPTPIILYVTTRSKRKISAELLGELARRVPQLIGTKDPGCDVATLKAMVAAAPGVAIFGGENDLLDKIVAGGRGTYSSVVGLSPSHVVRLYQLCSAGRWDEARPLQEVIRRLLVEVLIPMNRTGGLWDSAIDRVQRVAGGGVVGLRCQAPYRSATEEHVGAVRTWCQEHAPFLLPSNNKTSE